MAGRQMHVWVAALLMSSGVIAGQVDMSNASLTEIPEDTPTNITGWILSNNSLVMSASDINTLQKYPRITVLDLSYNHIQTLPPGAFDKLTDLETLKLRGNSLQTLDRDIFKGLIHLKSLDLEDNPWNCSCSLTNLIRELNDSGVSIGKEVTCDTPQKTAVLDGNPFCSVQSTTVKTSVEKSPATTMKTSSTPTPASTIETNNSHVNGSSKGLMTRDGDTQTGSHSWKFLLGVVALTLSTSTLIVCAIKSPSWYKLLFNYRHQRLREDVEHSVFNTGRCSDFSLDTEQTDTSAQELDTGPFEDEDDGFIEDGYIEPGNYREHTDES